MIILDQKLYKQPENSSPDQSSATVDNGRNQIERTNVGSCSTKHVKDV